MTDSTSQTTFNPGKGTGETVGVALLGLGTVGAEVLRLMRERRDEFAARVGGPLEVRGVAVSDVTKPREGVEKEILTDDALALVKRDDVDLVIEVIGGIDYPREVVLTALNEGKAVVTDNKALIAAQVDELSEAAEKKG